MIALTDQEFQTIQLYIRRNYGINLEKKRYVIESKLWIELARYRAETYTQYWQMLLADRTGTMKQRMIDLLTTNYTYFCRENQHFDFLERIFLPQWSAASHTTLTIWCAGCATGQECYTLAMTLLDCQAKGLLTQRFQIIGTDLSQQAITTAQKGIYSASDYARLPPLWQQLYCGPFSRGSFQIKAHVRSAVQFRRQNLLQPSGFHGSCHLAFCRNVLIYFQLRDRVTVLQHIADALAPSGYLFIGHSESLMNLAVPFDYIQPAIYRKAEDLR